MNRIREMRFQELENVDPRVLKITESAVKIFGTLGSSVEAANPEVKSPEVVLSTVVGVGLATVLQDKMEEWREQMDPGLVALIEQGKNPLIIDSKEPTIPLEDYAYNETRFRMLLQTDEQRADMLMKAAKQDIERRWELYRQMAAMHYNGGSGSE